MDQILYGIKYGDKIYYLWNDFEEIDIGDKKYRITELLEFIAKMDKCSHLVLNKINEDSKSYFNMKISNIIDNNIFKYINGRIKTNNFLLKNSDRTLSHHSVSGMNDDIYIKQSNILLNYIKNKIERIVEIYLTSNYYAKDFSLLIEPIYKKLNEETCDELYKVMSWQMSHDNYYSYIRKRMLNLGSSLNQKLLRWVKEKLSSIIKNTWITTKLFLLQNLLYDLYVIVNVFEFKEKKIIICMNQSHINNFIQFFKDLPETIIDTNNKDILVELDK